MVDNCLVCTFQSYLDSTFVPKCAEVNIQPKKETETAENHTAILPFLSLTAAVLVLVELAKVSSNIVASESVTDFRMRFAVNQLITDVYPRGCFICDNQLPKIHQKVISRSKYRHLSQV